MIKTLSLLFCLTLITSCGGNHKEFTESVRQNFLIDCQQGGLTLDSCQKTLACIEKRMTEDNFVVEYNLYQLEGKMPFNLSSAVSNCL